MAQDISGTNIAANAAAESRTVCVELRIAWGRDPVTQWPADWTTEATDETSRLMSMNVSRSLSVNSPLALGSGPVAEMSVRLDNHDQRYSPYNEAGPLYYLISDDDVTAGGTPVRYPKTFQVPVRLRMGFTDSIAGNEFVTLFTGVTDVPSEEYGLNGETITLRCLDRGATMLQQKVSSYLDEDRATGDWLLTLVGTYGRIAGGTYDASTYTIPYVWTDDENIWRECQLTAASEGGYFFFDETGAPQFKNAAWLVENTVSQATISTSVFGAIVPQVDWENVYTGALVEYQTRAPGGDQTIWRSDDVITVPPGGYIFVARYQYPVEYAYSPTVYQDYYPIGAAGTDMSAYCVFDKRLSQSAQRGEWEFSNTSDETVFVRGAQIRGRTITGGPTEEVERNVDNPIVPTKQHTISGNAYIQTREQAERLAVMTADRMRFPRLTIAFNNCKAYPWLQLGDLVTFSASDVFTNTRTAYITALSFSWEPSAPFYMNGQAVDANGLYEYTDYFVIGTSKYGTGTDRGRMFF